MRNERKLRSEDPQDAENARDGADRDARTMSELLSARRTQPEDEWEGNGQEHELADLDAQIEAEEHGYDPAPFQGDFGQRARKTEAMNETECERDERAVRR